MKKLYILLSVTLMAFIFQSCYKDKSTLATIDIITPAIEGIKPNYQVYTHQDTLRINPELDLQSVDYSFEWLLFTKNFSNNTGTIAKPDTLARTKDLNYVVTNKSGEYVLNFNVTDKKTGIVTITSIDLTISTLSLNGWYVLKDNGQETDFDFFHSKGKISNWIATFNHGKSLPGKAVKSIFVPNLKTKISTTDLFSAMAVITENDAAIFKIENGEMIYNFDNMFFSKPAVRKPQNILLPMSGNSIALINNNRSYSLVKGTLFADPAPNDFKISSIATTTSADLFFDEHSKKMFISDINKYSELKSNADSIKNMKATPRWMGGYAGFRNIAILLFKNTNNDKGRLFKLATGYQNFNDASTTLITMDKEVPASHLLNTAAVIGGNYDADILYYAKDHTVYMTDFSSLTETKQMDFPAGTKITSIEHIKFPIPAATVLPKINYIAISTELNGNYQIWLCSINSIGGLNFPSKPNFEGIGHVKGVNYLENGQGNRNY